MPKSKNIKPVISIFYNRSSWQILLMKCLKPLLIEMVQTGKISGYALWLGFRKGDHVSLAIKFDKVNSKAFFEVTASLEKFMLENRSPSVNYEYPLKSFFKNYPNNKVFYDVNEDHIYDKKCEKLTHLLSKIILEEIPRGSITLDEIYSYVIYLLISLLHSNFKKVEEAKINILLIRNSLVSWTDFAPTSNNSSHTFVDKFINSSNVNIVTEIIIDIWNDALPADIEWLREWELLCEQFPSHSFPLKYSTIARLILKHFGFFAVEKLIFLSTDLFNIAFSDKSLMLD